jgi:hypothetical protein
MGELADMTEANAATTTALPPCLFRFDDGPTWEGFAHGSTWNGFDNVAVTRETLDRIAEWAAETAVGDAEEARAQVHRYRADVLGAPLARLGVRDGDRGGQPLFGPAAARDQQSVETVSVT